VVVAIVVIAVVATRGGSTRGGRTPRAVGATTTSSASTAPTTAPPPAALAVAHLPATLPQSVSRASVVVEGGRLIVLGGLHGASPGTSTPQVLTVDPGTGAAQVAPPLAVATHDAAAVQLGTSVFVLGGGAGTTIATVQQWTGTGTRVVSHLPQARSDIAAAVVGGRGYVVGGFDGTKPTADVLVTDDGTTFHVAATLPVAVRYPAIAVLGSKIYVIGGQSVSGPAGNGPPVGDVQAVDVSNGSATVVSQLPGALTEASAFVLEGAVFVAGGVRGGIVQRSVFRLDPATGALTPVATLPEPRADAAVASVGATAYLIGGESPARLSSIVTLRAG
jgi:N-acetylneuraminic acid mutarotase